MKIQLCPALRYIDDLTRKVYRWDEADKSQPCDNCSELICQEERGESFM